MTIIISTVTILALLIYSFGFTSLFPTTYAQSPVEIATPSAHISPESSSSATPSLTPSPNPSITPTSQPLWKPSDGGYTIETLHPNVTYSFPPNPKVNLTFSKLPQSAGTITIKQITASTLGANNFKPVTEIAYDITSTMEDGTFEYTLTLPTPTTQNVEVKASEDGQNFVTLGGVTAQNDILTITGLNHFTIFVVAGTIASGQASAFDESSANIVINEFLFNPDEGNDWIELYNKSSNEVDLAGWKLDDSTSTMTTLNGLLPVGGFLVFEVSNRLNSASSGDTINLKNAAGSLIDQVSYKDSTTINGADNVGSVSEDESVGRTTDGVVTGDIWTVYSSPTKGYNNSNDPTFLNVGDIYPFESIQDGIDEVAEGGTVNVAAGNYEETVEIEQSLTLRGAGIGNSTIVDSDCGGDPTLSIDADDVTIQDLTIDNDGCGGSVVKIESERSGIVIQGNEIINGDYGIETSGFEGSLTIANNTIRNNDSTGIYLSGGGQQIINSLVTISGNTISSNDGNGIYADVVTSSIFDILNNTIRENDRNGIYICAEGECRSSTLTISGNSISGNDSNGLYLYDILASTVSMDDNDILNNNETGIYIRYIGTPTPSDPSSVILTNNTVSGNSSYGIYLGDVDDISQVEINSGNTISANSSSGIYLNSGVRGVFITGNTIENNSPENGSTGIVVRSATGNEAHRNVISGNGVGVENQDEDNFFDATENFWGHSAGPLHGDLNPKGQGDSVGDNVWFSPFYVNENLDALEVVELDTTDLSDFVENGIFDLPNNEEGQDFVEFLTVSQEFDFEVAGASEEEVTLPEGTRIERTDDAEFEWQDLSVSDISEDSLLGLSADLDAEGALQWGIPNVELEFNKPITIDISVGLNLNGKTLQVQRSTSGSGGWTTNGIVAPGTCTVSSGICTFQATKASYFVASSTVPIPTQTPATATTTTQSLSAASAPSCTDAKPESAPTLLLATPTGPNQVTITWSRAKDPVTYYLITYGLGPGLQQYGNPNVGGRDTTSYTIAGLSAATYYFKIRAGNGCTPGDFSNELSANPKGGFLKQTAVGFIPGVLGKKEFKPAGDELKPQQSPPASQNASLPAQQTSHVTLFTTFANFFKNTFGFLGKIFGN